MNDIYVYVEGGGDSKEQKAELRRGFDALFDFEKSSASRRRIGLVFVCCGGRQDAYEAFQNAVLVRSDRINAMLVDSESPISPVPTDRSKDALVRRDHLMQRQGTAGRGQSGGWDVTNVAPERIHLMVQCMEAWIVADPEALEDFYKKGFRKNKLPQRPNLEEEPKGDIYAKLEAATEKTQKGKYAKIHHASQLLQRIERDKIAIRCPRFSIFRDWLSDEIGVAAG